MALKLQELQAREAIVNPDGTPSRYFLQYLRSRGGALTDLEAQLLDVIDQLDSKVDKTTQVIAGTGLTGGGPLSSNVTLNANASSILDTVSSTRGSVLYRGASGWSALSPGTLGQALLTNGAGADPSWGSASGPAPDIQDLLDGISTTKGTIIYYDGTDWVALTPGTAGYVLRTNGSGQDPSWAAVSGGGSGTVPDINANVQYIPITFGVNNINGVGMSGTVSNTSSLSYASTNSFTKIPQMRIGTASANTFGQVRSTSALFQAGAGLKYSGSFGVHTAGANMRVMVGFYASGFTGANDPSNAINAFFIGKDSADTNLQIMHNDGSGTCTKVDLGSSFPANTSQTDHYYVELTIDLDGASASYYVLRVNTGDTATGSISTNLPTTNVGMYAGQWGCTGSTATACYLSFMGFQVQSPL